MRLSHFFIDRPIFAAVLSILMVIVGSISYAKLPVAQYPEVVPPTVVVAAAYPGANAQTIADTVATPIEQEINGVEGMLYMSSYSSSDGRMALTITFEIGTDLDMAQVLVQNRVNAATPRLPEEVRRLGITTKKSSPDMMMVVHMLSPDESLDQLYVSNYALLRVKDQLTRLDGVGDVQLFGAREYSIRVWLDPERMSGFGLSAGDVVRALREQNVQVSGGALGQPPVNMGNAFQFTVTTQGRFDKPEQFEQVIIKNDGEGRLVRVSDVARVELGAQSYVNNSYLNNKEAVAIAIFQRPGSNALETADTIIAKMDEMKKQFPKGLDYQIVYNPTEFIAESITAVYHTIFEAILLVVLVVIVFLQSWRAALIPIIAIPVSLIGTFAVMYGFGFSLNMLTLFGMVLAIGIVVDDAIVVVENVERHIREGMNPRDAAHKTIDEVGRAIIAISLVLCAVFIPTAFIPGMSGQFYKQFAMTIAVATIISTINSLTLSPSMAALLLKAHVQGEHGKSRFLPLRLFQAFAEKFNAGFDWLSRKYGGSVKLIARRSIIMLVLYGALVGGTVFMVKKVPTGFIPMQDQGYGIVVINLPDGASLQRTDDITKQAGDLLMQVPGIIGVVQFAGLSGATFTMDSNAAAIFIRFAPFEERLKNHQDLHTIIGSAQAAMGQIKDAFIIVIPPPPVRGIGNAGGYKMMIQDRTGLGLGPLMQTSYGLMGIAGQQPELKSVYTTFSTTAPQVKVNIDRTKAQILNVPLSSVFETLQVYLGSTYVNDFNAFGRIYQVQAQADMQYRIEPEDILKLKVRTATGELIPLGTFVQIERTTGPDLIQRYNMFESVAMSGDTKPGFSTGQSLARMEKIAADTFPPGIGYEWTELAYQQKQAGSAAVYIFALSVLIVFLFLAANYESWTLPLAIILIVPVSMLAALAGVHLRGMDNNILTQIGLVVLIGLAAKNAILIVEFAHQREKEGHDLVPSIIEACRLRLRPILMSSFAFVLGVVPLMIAHGPGAEMRQAMGTAVFAGMLGVTFFGLFLTPTFYYVIRRIELAFGRKKS